MNGEKGVNDVVKKGLEIKREENGITGLNSLYFVGEALKYGRIHAINESNYSTSHKTLRVIRVFFIIPILNVRLIRLLQNLCTLYRTGI